MRQFAAVLFPPLPYTRNTNDVSTGADNDRLVKETRVQLLLLDTDAVETGVIRLELKYRLKVTGPVVVDREPNERDETLIKAPDTGVRVNSKYVEALVSKDSGMALKVRLFPPVDPEYPLDVDAELIPTAFVLN
jgi:hypothetical protein